MKRLAILMLILTSFTNAQEAAQRKATVISSGINSTLGMYSYGRKEYKLKIGNMTYTVFQGPMTKDLVVGQDYQVEKIGKATVDLVVAERHGKTIKNGYVIEGQEMDSK